MKYFFLCVFSLTIIAVLLAGGCDNPTDTNGLNVDRDIPPSEDFNASYGFWGPEGKTIYFTHDEELGSDPKPGKSDQLWKLDLETGQREKIHNGRIIFPDISPDGEWFVFNSFAVPQYLFKMRSDGTDLQQLTGPNTSNPDFEFTIQGEWSPDGNNILFSLSAGEPRGVSIMKSSGADPHIIVPFATDPHWTTNGDKITYINFDTTKARKNREQIYIANPDGSNFKKITDLENTFFNIEEPILSPDGEKIVFTYNDEIYITKADSGDVEQATAGPGFAARPRWSPDGQTILFSRIIRNGPERLYYLEVATREVTPVFPKSE